MRKEKRPMLTRRTVLGRALAGGLGCLAPAGRARARDVIRVPFEVTDTGLAVVRAGINGRSLRFILDTGAEVSAIRHDLPASLGLRRTGRRAGTGADGRLLIADYEANEVVFGGALRLQSISLSAIPGLSAYDGLLAARFLTVRPSELDYGAREIRLYPDGAPDFGGYNAVAPRVVRRGASLSPRFYCPFSLGGQALSGLLDTGFETEVFLNAGIVARHDLWDRFPVRGHRTFTGVAGKRLTTRVVEMPDFQLGDIGRTSVQVTLADPATGGIPAIGADEAVLGASLLKRFSIAFDGDSLGFRAVA